MKFANAALTATKNIVTFPLTRERRERDELAFLPAALEIVETPPSPIGRAIGATLIALFCLALIWVSVGHVDIVASATGKIVPSGRIKLIQPFETGVVRAIHIHDGQSVKAGGASMAIGAGPAVATSQRQRRTRDQPPAMPGEHSVAAIAINVQNALDARAMGGRSALRIGRIDVSYPGAGRYRRSGRHVDRPKGGRSWCVRGPDPVPAPWSGRRNSLTRALQQRP